MSTSRVNTGGTSTTAKAEIVPTSSIKTTNNTAMASNNKSEPEPDVQSLLQSMREDCSKQELANANQTEPARADEIAELKQKVSSFENVKAEVKSLKRKLDDRDTGLECRVDELDEELVQSNENIEKLGKELAATTKKVDELSKPSKRPATQDSKANKGIKSLESCTGDLVRRMVEVEDRAFAKQKQISDLNLDVMALKLRAEDGQAGVKILEGAVNGMLGMKKDVEREKKKVEILEKEKKELQEKVLKLEAEIAKIGASLKDVSKILKHLMGKK